MPSEKEVEAALSAWNNYSNSGPVAEDRSDAMRVALEAAARVRAEANAEPAPAARSGVVVELEWVYSPLLCSYAAKTAFGEYKCIRTYADVSKLYLDDKLLKSFTTGSHEAAKAAAQADYERRILTALEAAEPATDVEPVAWCVWREPDTLKEGKRLTFNRAYAEGCKDHPEWTAIPLYTRPPESRLREAL